MFDYVSAYICMWLYNTELSIKAAERSYSALNTECFPGWLADFQSAELIQKEKEKELLN